MCTFVGGTKEELAIEGGGLAKGERLVGWLKTTTTERSGDDVNLGEES